MTNSVIENISKGGLAVLIDPDKVDEILLDIIIQQAVDNAVDFFFVGGSLISSNHMDMVVSRLKTVKDIPTILFPGNSLHVHTEADAILFLSLISGRNPEYLIGQHVISAPQIKRSGLVSIPTGYMLIDGGSATTASYMSNTTPIPNNKPDIAAATAMAGELLGLRCIYLDAGSGALNPVSQEIIKAVNKTVDLPIIVGGGINTVEKALKAKEAGASVIVIGNATEKNPQFIAEISKMVFPEKTLR